MARGTAVKIRWRVGGGRRAEDPDPSRPPPPNPKPFRSKITILGNSNRQSISTKWKSSALFPILGTGISKAYRRVWVFGYGSLVWNPGFEADEKAIGYIKDYMRVFDLACIDHRGTPEIPARTCTLEEDEGSICWRTAYCVRGGPEKERSAMEYLRRRECEYDRETLVDFYTDVDSEQPFITGMIVFTSTPDKVSNKYYLGPAPLLEMATQIATASGPCGNNREYIFRLEKALFDIGHEDEYVIELANEVRKVLGVSLELGRKVLDARLKSSLSPLALGPLQEGITTDLYLFF